MTVFNARQPSVKNRRGAKSSAARPSPQKCPKHVEDTTQREREGKKCAMATKPEIDQLHSEVTMHRDRAAQARRLAREVTHRLAKAGLLDHAARLEQKAQELEAEIAETNRTFPRHSAT
jgi:predicted RNase H-like nuclease (RuvC/YqgF family)